MALDILIHWETIKELIVVMLSFVDNCNQRIIGEKYKELSNLLQQAQHNMKLWNNLVSVSGTKLELLK